MCGIKRQESDFGCRLLDNGVRVGSVLGTQFCPFNFTLFFLYFLLSKHIPALFVRTPFEFIGNQYNLIAFGYNVCLPYCFMKAIFLQDQKKAAMQAILSKLKRDGLELAPGYSYQGSNSRKQSSGHSRRNKGVFNL